MDENLNNIKKLIEEEIVFTRKTNIIKEKSRLNTYFNIGKEITKAIGKRSEYGKSLLKKYSEELTKLYGKGYDYTNLNRMRQLYQTFEKIGSVSQQLSWTHYRCILSIKEESKRNYYINLAVLNTLTVRELKKEIKNNSYERLTNKEKENIKLIDKEYEPNILDMIKDPIIVSCNKMTLERLDEKLLKELLIDDIENTLLELGIGFSYVGKEKRIKVGDNYRFIDLVLFNIELNCYVLIELKINKLDIRDIGQIQFYVNYYDDEIKKPFHNKTVGIIICKKKDNDILKHNKSNNILVTSYKINN